MINKIKSCVQNLLQNKLFKIILIIITLIIIKQFLLKNIISLKEGNENMKKTNAEYKESFQRVINILKMEKNEIDKKQIMYDKLNNLYKCYNYFNNVKNKKIEEDRGAMQNTSQQAASKSGDVIPQS